MTIMRKEFDFYKSFDGEPELTISQKDFSGNNINSIKLWIGFFDSIIELIKPNCKDEWEGFILYYHTHTGLYDNSSWKCEEVILFIQQLESIEKLQLDVQTQEILEILIELLKESISSKTIIYFEYD
jgi:hypothetical protein